jgi:hypothetical protein
VAACVRSLAPPASGEERIVLVDDLHEFDPVADGVDPLFAEVRQEGKYPRELPPCCGVSRVEDEVSLLGDTGFQVRSDRMSQPEQIRLGHSALPYLGFWRNQCHDVKSRFGGGVAHVCLLMIGIIPPGGMSY